MQNIFIKKVKTNSKLNFSKLSKDLHKFEVTALNAGDKSNKFCRPKKSAITSKGAKSTPDINSALKVLPNVSLYLGAKKFTIKHTNTRKL